MVSKTQLDEALHEQTVTIENKINDSINKIREEIIDRLLLENTKLSTRIKEIEENVVVLEKSMIKNHQYQRNNNIGINEQKINKRDLEACHRLSVKNNGVVLTFVVRKDAKECLKNRSNLRDMNKESIGLPTHTKLFIDEQLSAYISQLAYMCRCLKRSNLISKHKLQNGNVKILLQGENDDNFYWETIEHKSDLLKIFPNIDDIAPNKRN